MDTVRRQCTAYNALHSLHESNIVDFDIANIVSTKLTLRGKLITSKIKPTSFVV